MNGGEAARGTFPPRSRKRWVIIGSVVAVWIVLYLVAGSIFGATLLLVAFAVAGTIAVLFLRFMGVRGDHPWIRRLASRPWRNGQDVMRIAVSHLYEVFVTTPGGSLFAPNCVEIQMNPEDLVSLCDQIELSVVIASATEFYREQVARYGARLANSEPVDVYVITDEWIPRGRYRLKQGHPAASAAAQREMEMPAAERYQNPAQDFAYAPQYADADYDRWDYREPAPARTVMDARMDERTVVDSAGPATVMEMPFTPVPLLRLVTGDSVAQTKMTGARAGRGSVELVLPNVPTISREHAKFAFSEGRWRVSNLGMNGITVNGTPVETEQSLSDGDTIRWGSRPDALVSRVEIG
jgi:FHA domain